MGADAASDWYPGKLVPKTAAAPIIRRIGSLVETANDLAAGYMSPAIAGAGRRSPAYNMLVKSWPELEKLASSDTGESWSLL